MFTLTSQDRPLYENGTLSVKGLQEAWERRDPRLAEYLVKLVILDPAPEGIQDALQEHKPNYLLFLSDLETPQWQKQIQAKDPTIPGQSDYSRQHRVQVIATHHHASWEELESEAALELLPDRLKVHALIEAIWRDRSAWSRSTLLQIIEKVPLKWGPWRALKRIFKVAAEEQDWELFAALVVRFDREVQRNDIRRDFTTRAPLIDKDGTLQVVYYNRYQKSVRTRPFSWDNQRAKARDVRPRTLHYLLRRAWRVLKYLAAAQPEAYAFVVAEVLIRYPAYRRVGMKRFIEAYPSLWGLSIEPLMRIVELGRNDTCLDFAFKTLETHFREELKFASPDWILRLTRSPQRKARRLAVRWFLEPICGVEQGLFHEHSLQRAVLEFLDYNDDKLGNNQPVPYQSWREDRWLQGWWPAEGRVSNWPQRARQYALDYIKGARAVIAQDLPLEKVLWLMRSQDADYRSLGEFLLSPSDEDSPYTDQLTLGVWTELLEDPSTFAFAERAIRTRFSGVDLTADWYAERLLSEHKAVRALALGFLRDETRYRVDDDWLAFHKTIVRSHTAQTDVLQRSLYQLSRRDDDGHAHLDDLEPAFLRMLLVHPKEACHQSLIGWRDGGRVSLEALSVAFLKELSAEEDWKERRWLSLLEDEATKEHSALDYIPAVGAAVRGWLKTESTLSDLGYDWAKERVESFAPHYDFVRDLFRQQMPWSALAEASDASDAAAQGLARTIERILAEKDAASRTANFYRSFILSRHPLIRRDDDPNLPPLAEPLQLPRAALDFGWFEKMAVDARHPIRSLAMRLADVELARWTVETPLSFPRLKPLLRDAYDDIRAYLVRAMSTPRRPEGRLDVDQPQFKVEELYAWCFDAQPELRALGMAIIAEVPGRFGQPSELLKLSESTDRKVREMVIEVVWKQLRELEVTPSWQPNERSVVPQSLSLSRAQRVVVLPLPPPQGRSPDEIKKNRKYLGVGAPEQSHTKLEGMEMFSAFLRGVLFQLPPVRQSPRLPARQAPLKGAWRDKRTLILAVRDLALRDREFAIFVLPILKEFQQVRGKMVRDASLAALAWIDAAHPDLSALEGVA